MTFVLILVPVLIGAALCFAMWRDALPLLDRLVSVHERRYAAPASHTAPNEPMPDDLIATARSLAGEWAQDDVIASMREAYAELGDWTKVRARFHEVWHA